MAVALLTFTEASSFLFQDCSPREGNSIHLHTRDATTEVTSVSSIVLGSHPHRIVGGQFETSNVSFRYESVVDEKFGNSSSLVVGCAHELPTTWFYSIIHNGCGLTTITSCETNEQLLSWCHPEVYSPASWVVVEDRSTSSSVLDPSQKGDGIFGVQFACVSKLSITVHFAKESVSTSTCSIWTCVRSDVNKSSCRVSA